VTARADLPPYVDHKAAKAGSHKPFAVLLRGGRTGSLVAIRHFATAGDAVAFWKEHLA
jgi:hypothetical protein